MGSIWKGSRLSDFRSFFILQIRWDYFRMDCVIRSVDWRTSLVFISLHVSNLNLKATIDPQIGRIRLSLISLYSSLKDFRAFFLSSIPFIVWLFTCWVRLLSVCVCVLCLTLHQHKKLRWLLRSASRSVCATLFSKQSSFMISFYIQAPWKVLETPGSI